MVMQKRCVCNVTVLSSTVCLYSAIFQFSFGAHETKRLHQNGTFHSRSVAFRALPKQLKLVGTGRNWFDPVLTSMTENRNSVAYHTTSALDFNKRGCVR